jgi:hypothetical protein
MSETLPSQHGRLEVLSRNLPRATRRNFHHLPDPGYTGGHNGAIMEQLISDVPQPAKREDTRLRPPDSDTPDDIHSRYNAVVLGDHATLAGAARKDSGRRVQHAVTQRSTEEFGGEPPRVRPDISQPQRYAPPGHSPRA